MAFTDLKLYQTVSFYQHLWLLHATLSECNSKSCVFRKQKQVSEKMQIGLLNIPVASKVLFPLNLISQKLPMSNSLSPHASLTIIKPLVRYKKTSRETTWRNNLDHSNNRIISKSYNNIEITNIYKRIHPSNLSLIHI